MPRATPFSINLSLILKALSMTRGRLAVTIGVDKSVAGRWCSGGSRPSAHSLDLLTRFVAGRVPGFTMLDWEVDTTALAARLGVTPVALPAKMPSPASLIPAALLEEGLVTTRLHGAGYEGFWRTTRPSAELDGRFVHDHMCQRLGADGLLRYRLGVFDLRFEGWSLAVQNQLFSIASDPVSGVFIFSIVSGVGRRKAMTLDGITLTCLRNLDGTIISTPCVWERVGDLSGDVEADNLHLEALLLQSPFPPEGSVTAEIVARLLPDIGPAAQAAGGDLLLILHVARSLSRGAPLGGRAYSPD